MDTFTIDNMLSSMSNMLPFNDEEKKMESERDDDSSEIDSEGEYNEEGVEDSEEESGNQEQNIQLFTDELRRDYIDQYYPDLKEVSYQELQNFTKVIRNEKGYITDPLHRTLPFLSKFEKTRIIGYEQLN